ncbi:MAG: DUF542 domain-containing protein [Planctomycetota bacterium]|jgi:regulator of cell morphogenesis and NO signaling
MSITAESKVGRIAVEHPLATRVFARHHIDFCCGGGKPLKEAVAGTAVDLETVLLEIETEIAGAKEEDLRWDDQPLAELIDHILAAYHVPLVHGEKDPERLKGIHDTFQALRGELEQHMGKEEEVLFPMILAGQGKSAFAPISVMESEHDMAGQMLLQLRQLTDDYRVPDEACNTWRALWVGLEDLERALHQHIHLENNILHKRALAGD